MATVLESLTVPRSSALLPSFTRSHIAASSVSSLSARRLPLFTGLKVKQSITARSLGSVTSSSRLARRGGLVVCEAQDTAIEGQDRSCEFYLFGSRENLNRMKTS